MAKQPRSWRPAEGEIRPSQRRDEVVLDGERVSGPYVEESCRAVKNHPAVAGTGGSRVLVARTKAMDGAKNLEVQHPRTRRRRGIGTFTQPTTEQERSVSAPALWPRAATPRCPVTANSISGEEP